MRIIHTHVCPSCRIEREGWDVEGTKAKAQVIAGRARKREPLDAAAIELLRSADEFKLADKCEACGQRMTATLLIEQDEASGIPIIGPVVEGDARRVPMARAAFRAEQEAKRARARLGLEDAPGRVEGGPR